MNLRRSRRYFLNLVTVTALGAFGAACGVKGPLYFPDEAETQKKEDQQKDKDKDKEKTSRRQTVPEVPTLG